MQIQLGGNTHCEIMMEPFVFALATLSLVDSVCFMIVTPSLAFYVSSLGGSQDFYVSYWQYTHSLRFVASPFLDDGGKLVLHIMCCECVYMISVFLLPVCICA